MSPRSKHNRSRKSIGNGDTSASCIHGQECAYPDEAGVWKRGLSSSNADMGKSTVGAGEALEKKTTCSIRKYFPEGNLGVEI